MDNFLTSLLQWTADFAVAGAILSGCFLMGAITVFIPYLILNYIYKRTKILAEVFSFFRHKKEFMEWKKNKKTDVIKPNLNNKWDDKE